MVNETAQKHKMSQSGKAEIQKTNNKLLVCFKASYNQNNSDN